MASVSGTFREIFLWQQRVVRIATSTSAISRTVRTLITPQLVSRIKANLRFWDSVFCIRDLHTRNLLFGRDVTSLYWLHPLTYSCWGLTSEIMNHSPITVVTWSKAWNVFALSNAGIVDSNPTQGMDACVRSICVCVVLCVGRGLATGWFPVQGVLPTVYRIEKQKKRPRPNKGL
jgi:hypothetical protein